MKSYNYEITSQSLHDIIDFNLFSNEQNLLIQVFCGKDKQTYKATIETLLKELPHAICIGTSSDGEIINEEINLASILVSISVFNHTLIKSAYSKEALCFDKGQDLAKQLTSTNTKVIILFADLESTTSVDLLEGIQSIDNTVIISGGMSSKNTNNSKSFISCGSQIIHKGVVGVSLSSDILSVQNDFRFNWSSIGIEHTITKALKNKVLEINGINTLEFYKKCKTN